VFGSICLDYEIGGLIIQALENSVQLGAKVVWMPTFSSANSRWSELENVSWLLVLQNRSLHRENRKAVVGDDLAGKT
jgi:hypothetical protein